MSQARLPPTPPILAVAREQLRTVLHGWGVLEWAAILYPLPVLGLWWILSGHGPSGLTEMPLVAWAEARWPHPGYLGWGWLAGLWAGSCLAGALWGPSVRSRMENPHAGVKDLERWRSSFLGAPVDRRTHTILRAAAGALLGLPLISGMIFAGALLEWWSSGNWPIGSLGAGMALLGAPLLVFVSCAALLVRPSLRSAVALSVVLLLLMVGSRVQGVAVILIPLLHGELGLVTGLTGGSVAAVAAWLLAATLLFWKRAGGGIEPIEAGSWLGLSGAGSGVGPAPRPPKPMPALLGETGFPSGRLPPVPTTGALLRDQVESIGDPDMRSELANGLVVGLVVGAIVLGFMPSVLREAGAASPFLVAQGVSVWLAFSLAQHDRFAPHVFPTLGAPPTTRRRWVLTRFVALLGLAAGLGGLAHLGAAAVQLASTGSLSLPGGRYLLNTLGLGLVGAMIGAGGVAMWNRRFLGTAVLLFAPTVIGAIVAAAVLIAPIEGNAYSAYLSLTMIGAFGPDPAPASTFAIIGWSLVFAAVLWVAVGPARGSTHWTRHPRVD